MSEVMRALGRALSSLLHPKLLLLSLLPPFVSALLWISVALWFWAPLNDTVSDWLRQSVLVDWVLHAARAWFHSDAGDFVPGLAKLLVLVSLLPLAQATALLIAAVFAMPLLVRLVARRDYPSLERRHGGSFLRSMANAVIGALLFLILWIVTLPLWLVPGVVLVLPLLLSAYLNQRMFCYDAVAEHADAAELHAITRGYRSSRYALGGILGATNYIPFFGWFAQVFIGLAYVHWGLATIQKLRNAATTREASAEPSPLPSTQSKNPGHGRGFLCCSIDYVLRPLSSRS
jgi:CysZ protein